MPYAHYYTLTIVIGSTGLLGCAAGIMGAFALLRKQALLGDTIAHACLPGAALIFLVTHNAHPLMIAIGSTIAGVLAAWCIHMLSRHTQLKMDAILGCVLSTFFGGGLVCITLAQKYPIPHQATITSLIFGNAATLFLGDSVAIGIVACIILLCIALFWKELVMSTFDFDYSITLGYTTTCLSLLMTALLILTIAIGLHMVGAVLMSTLLVAPGTTARLWTTQCGPFIISSALLGALFGISGTIISSYYTHMPTGPVIALVATTTALCALTIKSYTSTPRTIPAESR